MSTSATTGLWAISTSDLWLFVHIVIVQWNERHTILKSWNDESHRSSVGLIIIIIIQWLCERRCNSRCVMADAEQRFRLVVLGSGRVGKSSIIRRLLKDDYVDLYKPTVEDLHCRDYFVTVTWLFSVTTTCIQMHCRDYVVSGSTIKVDILDTAGNLEFPAMRRLSISTAHAFLLVYSIDDLDSFQEVRQLWQQIREQRTGYQELPCVVAGNKV